MKNLVFYTLKKNLPSLIFVFVLNILISLTLIIIDFNISGFIDRMLVISDFSEIKKDLMNLSLIMSFSIVILIVHYYVSEMLTTKIMGDINKSVLSRVQTLPLLFFNNKDTSFITQSINIDSFELSSFYVSKIMKFFTNIITIVVVLIIIYRVDVIIFLSLCAIIPLYLLIYMLLRKTIHNRQSVLKNSQSNYFSSMFKQLLNIRTTKINSWMSDLNKSLHEDFESLYTSYSKFTKINVLYDNLSDIISKVLLIGYIIFGGIQLFYDNLSVGNFVLCLILLQLFTSKLNLILGYFKEYQNMLVSFNRCDAYYCIEAEPNGVQTLDTISSIAVSDLSFAYNEKQELFNNYNGLFTKGNIYCVMGENGSGKSTLINLLLGLYKDYDGCILLDNCDIRDLDMYKIRKKYIAVVEQEPNLFGKTVKDNLIFGLETQVLEEKIIEYAQFLKIHDFIEHLESGYDTFVSEDTLSGGQKQKIALVRSLIKEPAVLILDEPTSALDEESTIKLFQLLKTNKTNRITIVITHDEAFAKIADQLVLI
ncbi:ATP-binding cassette domain-containing protein [Fusibacter bizertensis]